MSDQSVSIIRWCAVIVAILILLPACSENQRDNADPKIVPPTRTLIPPTVTPTVEAMPATPTPTDLPSPSTLVPVVTEAASMAIPPAVQTLIDRTMADLVASQGVTPADVRLLSVDAFTWHDPSWDCQTRPASSENRPGVTQGYRVVFSAGNRNYVYHTDTHTTFFLCEDAAWLAAEGQPVIVDPIAQSMVELTIRDAARRLKVLENGIELTSVLVIIWPDSSLGCPKPGIDYEDTMTTGYRIILRAAEKTFIYHTSTRDFVLCTPEEEILPGLIREAIPTLVP